MQKKFAVITAMLLGLSLCGCEDNTSTASVDESSISESLNDADTTTTTETTAVTSSTETTALTVADSISDNGEPSQYQAVELYRKLSNWSNGNVRMNLHYSQDGQEILAVTDRLGDRFYTHTKMADLLTMTILFDGTNSYMIDEESQTYAQASAEETGLDTTASTDIPGVSEDTFLESGTETIGENDYSYEKYQTEDDAVWFYFNPNGDICYLRYGSQQEVYIEFEVELLDVADDSKMKLPAGYTEISSEEMGMKIAEQMFSTLGEALGGLDSEEPIEVPADET